MRWHELFSAHFRRLSKEDIAVWDEILARKFTHLPEDELCAAINIMAEQKRQGEIKVYADIDHLISAIIKGRWESQQARDGYAPAEKCGLCSGGWLSFLGTNDGMIGAGGSLIVPCLCGVGQKKLAERYESRDHSAMKTYAQKVIDWITGIRDDAEYETARFARRN